MAHNEMFDDGDPLLVRVREIALAFPGAAEKVSHGRPAFTTAGRCDEVKATGSSIRNP